MLDLPKKIEKKIEENIKEFHGDPTTLESAVGALIVGQYYGWRVLKMLHSPATYLKYEKILGIKFADHMRERTEQSTKCRGIRIADKLNSFWSVVRGKHKIPNKGYFEK